MEEKRGEKGEVVVSYLLEKKQWRRRVNLVL